VGGRFRFQGSSPARARLVRGRTALAPANGEVAAGGRSCGNRLPRSAAPSPSLPAPRIDRRCPSPAAPPVLPSEDRIRRGRKRCSPLCVGAPGWLARRPFFLSAPGLVGHDAAPPALRLTPSPAEISRRNVNPESGLQVCSPPSYLGQGLRSVPAPRCRRRHSPRCACS
jgi:hypothetical protein